MAYVRICMKKTYEIARRWHAGHSISDIARNLNHDRKTVRRMIRLIKAAGISQEMPLPDSASFEALLKDNGNGRSVRTGRTAQLLMPYREELLSLVRAKDNPLLPKFAFEVIVERHRLQGQVSYPSFKRFYRAHCDPPSEKTTCRIETDPGDVVQIDYAKMGLLFDHATGRRRSVYAFIATLGYSRHKFVEFVFKQDQKSFTASHVHMFDYFGGVPSRLSFDNLKAGVIKPDLYDPLLNRTYAEMAEFYGCFLDPCRVASPTEKGKVERDVQSVRQQFRKFLALDENADLATLNRKVRDWICSEYGQRSHGTTGLLPYQDFLENEKDLLKPLPKVPFEIPVWKRAKVHPDNYVQFGKKFFSVPHTLEEKHVWIRATEKILSIYDDRQQLIKQHLITSRTRHTDWGDFPENVRAALGDDVQRNLIVKASSVGPNFRKLIKDLLEIHAFLNLRRAQAIVRLKDDYPIADLEEAASYLIEKHIQVTPKIMKRLLEENPALSGIDKTTEAEQPPDIGEQTQSFIRPADYFLNP